MTMASQSYQKLVAEKGARDVFSLMRYAKVAAVERQGAVHLQADKENRRAWLEADSTNLQTGKRERRVIRNSFCKPVQLATGVRFEQRVFMGEENSAGGERSASECRTSPGRGAS